MENNEVSGILSALNYNPRTGVFRWAANRGARGKEGSVAGCLNTAGYVVIRIEGFLYLAHRLAYLCVNGHWPSAQVDHRNGSRRDNRWSNLRSATALQNSQNCSKRRVGASGYRGVAWRSRERKWTARIRIGNGQYVHLGYFLDKETAALAYNAAATKYHGAFAVLNLVTGKDGK